MPAKPASSRSGPWFFFVVVLVVLSVVAGYYANEKRREAARAAQLDTELARCKTSLADRQGDLDALQRSLATVQAESAKYRSERDELAQKLSQLREAGPRKPAARPAAPAPAAPKAAAKPAVKPGVKAPAPGAPRPRAPAKAPAPAPAPKKR